MQILIVEDEPRVANLIAKGLRAAGYSPLVALDGDEGLRLALEGQADLMLLDIMMSGKDGVEVLRRVRANRPDLPVIMLTVRDEVDSKVTCLDEGANDYLTKPFSFAELTARIRAHLRQRSAPTSFILRLGDLALNLKAHEAMRGSRRISLTATEFRLLELFMRHPRQVLERSQILDHVWGYDYGAESNVVDVYVGYLRRKLGLDAGRPRIETVRGCGYRLETD